MLYYTFTSLSTVGFGDFHPVNSYERVLSATVLLAGVIVFSYFLGSLCNILIEFQELSMELDQGDDLNKFF